MSKIEAEQSEDEAGDVKAMDVDRSSFLSTAESISETSIKCESADLPLAHDRSKSCHSPVILDSCQFEPVDGSTVPAAVPTMQANERGVITVRLPRDLTVEVTSDEDIRVIGKQFEIFCMNNGEQLGILHPNGRIFCKNDDVHAMFSASTSFRASNEPWTTSTQLSTIGQPPVSRASRQLLTPLVALVYRVQGDKSGICFNSSQISESVLLNPCKRPIKLTGIEFPEVPLDAFSKLIHGAEKDSSVEKLLVCQSKIKNATLEYVELNKKHVIQLKLGDLFMRQNVRTGELEIVRSEARLRFVPQQLEVSVRLPETQISCRKGGIGYFQSGDRRFYTSHSGIVVSNSKNVTTVDNFGQFVCY